VDLTLTHQRLPGVVGVAAYRMDLVITVQLGRSHPLARHLDDFLTDLADAGASVHTRPARPQPPTSPRS
jgi:hypothetical protein